jgi:hypothetical protein
VARFTLKLLITTIKGTIQKAKFINVIEETVEKP